MNTKKLILLALLALAFLGGSLALLAMASLAFSISVNLGIFTAGIAVVSEVIYFTLLIAIYGEVVRHWKRWKEGGDA